MQTAQAFVDRLRVHDLEGAYRLTTRRNEAGKDLDEFGRLVHQQWPGAAPALVQLQRVWPFQSYGNRLRRWLRGREVDPPELRLDFSVDGVPFEVRETRGDGGWKVSFFQSHAG